MDKRKEYRRHPHREHEGDTSPFILLMRGCLCGLLISFAGALIFLSITSAYALTKPNPQGVLLPIASFTAYPCAILGGFVSCKVFKQGPILCGLVYGLLTVVLSMLLYPVLPATNTLSGSPLAFFLMRGILLLCCVCGCLLGSKLFMGTKKRHHRRR